MVAHGRMVKSAAVTEGAFIYQNSRKTHMGEVGSSQMGQDGPMILLLINDGDVNVDVDYCLPNMYDSPTV